MIITVLSILLAKRHTYLIIGWLFFLGTLVPVIGLVQVGYQSMADRYTYIPYLGLFLMLVWTLRSILARVKFGVTAFAMLVLTAAPIFAFISYRQVGHWKNSETIYRHSLSISKKHVLAANNLCFLLVDQDRIDEAKGVCSDSMQYAEMFPLLYNTMGIVSLKAGDIDEAKSNFEKYLRWVPYDAFGHFNLATAQLMKQDPIAAENSLARAAALNRGDLSVNAFAAELTQLANQFTLMSDHGKAADALRRLLYLDPENADARYKLAKVLYVSGDLTSAREDVSIAEKIKPDDPNIKILAGKILVGLGEKTLALERFETAMKVDPTNAEAKENIRKLRGGK
ncbi:tetratricopeptide repeat protein [Leptolyngbya sp. 15MV]|nr:tetratricopeptide repeat protein [Leptolyngbya sp. 15MV]